MKRYIKHERLYGMNDMQVSLDTNVWIFGILGIDMILFLGMRPPREQD